MSSLATTTKHVRFLWWISTSKSLNRTLCEILYVYIISQRFPNAKHASGFPHSGGLIAANKLSSLVVHGHFELFGHEVDGFLLRNFVGSAYTGSVVLALGYAQSRTSQHYLEVHTIDSDLGIVLETQIDVLADTKAEVSLWRETTFRQFVGLHTEGTLKDLNSFCATHCDKT